MSGSMVYWVALLAIIVSAVIVMAWGFTARADTIYVNVTNGTVYVKFGNLTIINFTRTIINIGWINNTHLGCAYSCLYATSPENDCDRVKVEVYDGTVLKYQVEYDPSSNNTALCPPSLQGMCVGYTVFNVTDFENTPYIIVKDLDTNETRGPFAYPPPYQGPRLEGYAEYIAILVPYGVLISLAGRLSMKNVGIGLVIYGLLVPLLATLGANIRNLMLASSISIILGVVLIWMSNQ